MNFTIKYKDETQSIVVTPDDDISQKIDSMQMKDNKLSETYHYDLSKKTYIRDYKFASYDDKDNILETYDMDNFVTSYKYDTNQLSPFVHCNTPQWLLIYLMDERFDNDYHISFMGQGCPSHIHDVTPEGVLDCDADLKNTYIKGGYIKSASYSFKKSGKDNIITYKFTYEDIK